MAGLSDFIGKSNEGVNAIKLTVDDDFLSPRLSLNRDYISRRRWVVTRLAGRGVVTLQIIEYPVVIDNLVGAIVYLYDQDGNPVPDNDTVVDDEPGERTVDVLDGDSVISMLDDYFDSDSLVDVTENKKSPVTVVQAISKPTS